MSIAQLEEQQEELQTNIPDQLRNYMKTLQFFDDNIDDYIYIYDIQAEKIYFTNKICKRFPVVLDDDNSTDFNVWKEIIYPKDRKFLEHYRQGINTESIKTINMAHRIIDHEGNKVWVNVKGSMRDSQNGRNQILVGRISEMVLGRMVDGLTGLCGTEKFMEDLKQYLEMSGGYLMVLGIDNFKNINITQGRTAGDDLLKHVTAALDQWAEYPLNLYRLDGDCFAVIFPDKQRQDVVEFYDSVKHAVADVCTISAGVVAYESGFGADNGEVYQYAENALDQAKKEGKNTLVFFSQNNYQRDLEQIELLDEIRDAIRQDCKGFSLNYQPQIKSSDFEIFGVEALLRYNSPSRENVSPAELIPLLENSGLICEVGRWVLKTALTQCKEWRKSIPNLCVSVNLSHVQLQQNDIVDTVLDLLNEAELPGEALKLEVTESIQLEDYTYLNKIFYAWKQRGIQISIDDFGTGYSSLSYLKSIEIDEVKIDRCFVDHVHCNEYNYRLLRNMIELAHSAKINICCEGVETFEEFQAIQELHTDLYQGFLFAKAYTKEQFEQAYIFAETEEFQERQAKEAKFRNMECGENKELIERLRREEISNITESMDEIVYVSDIDNYELYYLNAAGRQITGAYDYKGRKCYQVLRGVNKPCADCTNNSLCENKFYVRESENTHLKRNYILKDKLIRWQGKIVRLEIAIDITEREIVSKAIQKKLDFEQAIVEACKLMASESAAENPFYGVLKIIGEFYQADRVYTLKPNENGVLEVVHQWCAEGLSAAKNIEPESIETSDQRISAPIMRANKLIGYVEVENPRHRESGFDLVNTIAYFMGYTMLGEETQQKLNYLMESRFGDIRNHTDLGLWEIRLNPENGEGELYPDKVMCRIMGMEENLPPKDSYIHWYSRIKAGYYDYINEAVNRMIESGKITHVKYPWISPTDGQVMVQCVGIRREDCDGMICLEGYHWITNK